MHQQHRATATDGRGSGRPAQGNVSHVRTRRLELFKTKTHFHHTNTEILVYNMYLLSLSNFLYRKQIKPHQSVNQSINISVL